MKSNLGSSLVTEMLQQVDSEDQIQSISYSPVSFLFFPSTLCSVLYTVGVPICCKKSERTTNKL